MTKTARSPAEARMFPIQTPNSPDHEADVKERGKTGRSAFVERFFDSLRYPRRLDSSRPTTLTRNAATIEAAQAKESKRRARPWAVSEHFGRNAGIHDRGHGASRSAQNSSDTMAFTVGG